MTALGSVRVDKFHRAIQVFRREFSRNADLELKRQGRLFVKTCIQLTPPFPQTSPMASSLSQHRKTGENATVRDINKVFVPIEGDVKFRKGKPGFAGLSFDWIPDAARRERVKQTILGYARSGNIAAIDAMLQRMKHKNFTNVIQFVDPALHKMRRDRRGRVRKGKGAFLVADSYGLKRYIEGKVRNVGLAKSGWQRPYYALGGPRLPAWISEHPVRGIFSDGRDPRGLFVHVGNDIPWIQSTGQELHIMERATHQRARNMAIEMAKLVEHSRRRARFF